VVPLTLGDVEAVRRYASNEPVAKPILDVAIVVANADAVRSVTERPSAAAYLDRGDKSDNGGYLLVRETVPRVRAVHMHPVEKSDPELGHWGAFGGLLRRDAALRSTSRCLACASP
jgi:hypothetical protein